MNALIQESLSSLPVLQIGLDVAAKSVLWIVLAAVAARLVGRRRVLLRSAIWNACLVGLVVLPASSIGLPHLRLTVLPPAEGAAAGSSGVNGGNDETILWRTGDTSGAGVEIHPGGTASADVPVDVQAGAAAPRMHWAVSLLAVYLVGVVLLLFRLGRSLQEVQRLRRSAALVREPGWLEAFEQAAHRLELTGGVRLLCSDRIGVPVAFGWLHPVALIPERLVSASSPADRSAIVLHELAHIRRGDYAWQVLLRLLQAVYWPNPLICLVGRQVMRTREEACDALCLYHATNRKEYQMTLLEVSRFLVRQPVAAMGLAMARTNRIGRRLERIDHGVPIPWCRAGRCTRMALAAIALLLAGTVGAVELARANGGGVGSDVQEPPAPAATSEKSAPTTQPTRMRFFVLLVVGKDDMTFEGQPVASKADLEQRLEQVPHRSRTVLELAVASMDLTLREFDPARNMAADLVSKLGFEYLSYVGVRPLGSKGTPPQTVPARRILQDRRAKDTTQAAGGSAVGLAIVATADGTAKRPHLSEEQKKAYVEQLDRSGPERGRQQGEPYQWFELVCDDLPEHAIVGTSMGRKYLLVHARPTMAILPSIKGAWSQEVPAIEPATGRKRPFSCVFVLNRAQSDQYRALTKANMGRSMVLIYKDKVRTISFIEDQLTGTGPIVGWFEEGKPLRIESQLRGDTSAPASR